jgi:hypothetical protein
MAIFILAWLTIGATVGAFLWAASALVHASTPKMPHIAPESPTEADSVAVGRDSEGLYIVGRAVRL